MDRQHEADRDTPARDLREPREPYEPPTAEDVDTSYSPSETAAQISPVGNGIEESSRWH